MSEPTLAQRAIRGDRPALIALLERHGPVVRQRLAGHIPQRWQSVLTTDDVMQEAYTDAFLGIARFEDRGDGSFEAWFTTLAKRSLLDAVRMLETDKRGGARRQIGAVSNDESFVQLCDLVSATSTTPSRHAARDEALAAMRQAIEQLPAGYRQVVHLYDLEGRSIEEVASAMKCRPGAAYMRRMRAHRMLAEFMGTGSNFFSQTA